ncbi:MAG: DUF6709 family protein [Erysipelothrix sp.]
MKELIKKRKRNANRILWITLAIIIGLSLIMSGPAKQVLNSYKSFQAKDVDEIMSLYDTLESGKPARINTDGLDDSGYYYGSKNKAEFTYTLAYFDDIIVIVKQPGYDKYLNLFDDEGSLVVENIKQTSISQEGQYRIIEDFAEYLEVEPELIEDEFYPFVVGAVGITSYSTIYLTSIGLVLAVGLALFFYKHYRALNDLEKEFNADEMDRIDEEMHDALFRHKNMILTPHYLICFKGMNIKQQVIPIDSLGWVYKVITTTRVYGIPTGSTYALQVCINHCKKELTINMSEPDVERVIEFLGEMDTKAVLGFHKSFRGAWNRSRDVNQFREEIGIDDIVDNESEAIA